MTQWVCPACGKDTLRDVKEPVTATEDGVPGYCFGKESFKWCGPCWIKKRNQDKVRE